MPFYEMLPGGMPAGLQSDMNAVLNKKWGTSTTYPAEDWPETVNLMGPLPEKTVSGSVVAFSDGADAVPLKSCAVTIAPTLDGVSSVGVVHGGYNFIDQETAEFGNLNITTGNVDTSSQSWKTTDFMPLFAGDFIFTWVSSSTYFQVKWVAYDSNKTRIDGESTATWTSVYSKQFTFPTGTAFVRFCWSVIVSGNPVTREDIRLNRGTVDLGYTDYVTPTTHTANLGRTIYGGEVDVVNGIAEPKNWIDDNLANIEQGTISGSMGTNVSANNRVRNINMTPFSLDEIRASYSLTIPTDYKLAMRFYKEDGTFIEPPSWAMGFINQIPQSYVGQGVKWARFVFAKTDDSVITPEDVKNIGYMLEKGNTATPYSPYFEPFTFTPVPIISRLGDNTLWGDGDLSVTYRRDIDLALAQ